MLALAFAWLAPDAVASASAPASGPAATTTATQASTSGPAAGSKLWDSPRGDGPAGIPARQDGGAGGLVLQMLAYVIVILALGAVGIIVVKRVLPRIGKGAGRNIAVVETIHLGPRQAVHVLRVGSSKLLVGSSRDGVAMIADVTQALAQERTEAPPPPEGKPKAEQ